MKKEHIIDFMAESERGAEGYWALTRAIIKSCFYNLITSYKELKKIDKDINDYDKLEQDKILRMLKTAGNEVRFIKNNGIGLYALKEVDNDLILAELRKIAQWGVYEQNKWGI